MIQRVNVAVKTGSASDVDAWWKMPVSRDEAQGYPIVLPHGATWIGLDPATTSPHVSIVVDVPGLGPTLLVPGAAVPTGKTSRVTAWNAVQASRIAGSTNISGNAKVVTQYGRIGFICGGDDRLGWWLEYANRVTQAAPKVTPIIEGAFPVNDEFYFPTTNLRGIRILAAPADANGAPVAVDAAFSVTLRHRWAPLRATWKTGHPLDVPPAASGTYIYSAVKAAANDVTLTDDGAGSIYTQWTEVQIVTPGLAGLVVSALAGAGTVTAIIVVEGI